MVVMPLKREEPRHRNFTHEVETGRLGSSQIYLSWLFPPCHFMMQLFLAERASFLQQTRFKVLVVPSYFRYG
jgi:hypothetical protein